VVPVVLSEVVGVGGRAGSATFAKLQQAGLGDQANPGSETVKSSDHGRAIAAGAGQRHRQAIGRAVQYPG
jgi:hypothetical protein